MPTLKPDILTHPNIPKPLHGLSPRTIKGDEWWNETRKEIYKKYDYHCVACGVAKEDAKLHKWLEAHEFYDINYKTGIVRILSIEPLCHYCHNFIHSGRLEAILAKGEITKELAADILNHGFRILSQKKLRCFPGTYEFAQKIGVDALRVKPYDAPEGGIAWKKWKLIFEGKEYYSKFSCVEEWDLHYKFFRGGAMGLQRKAAMTAPVEPAATGAVSIPANSRSKPVLVIGRSGTGKTRAIVGLDPKKTFLVNVLGKDLPIKGWRKSYVEGKNMLISDDYSTITKALEEIKGRPEIKYVVVDDFQYLMANEFMRRSFEKGYEKFTEIGRHAWDLLWLANTLGNGRIVYFLAHSDINDLGEEKVKTIGKLLDEKIVVEGMFTIVLSTVVDKGNYFFTTHNNGKNTVKSPEGMFDADLIPNDLNGIAKAIAAYEN